MSTEIFVSLRTAASAEAPDGPMKLPSRLQRRDGAVMVREQACQWALTERQTLRGGGALQVGDVSLLEDGGELGGTRSSDCVVLETVNERRRGAGTVRE